VKVSRSSGPDVRKSVGFSGQLNVGDNAVNVRHVHDNSGFKLLACATTQLMRVGPSEPVCRDRFQTTSSGADQKSGSGAQEERPEKNRSGVRQKEDRKGTTDDMSKR